MPKKQVPKQLEAWLSHVQNVRSQNPHLTYKEILKLASRTK